MIKTLNLKKLLILFFIFSTIFFSFSSIYAKNSIEYTSMNPSYVGTVSAGTRVVVETIDGNNVSYDFKIPEGATIPLSIAFYYDSDNDEEKSSAREHCLYYKNNTLKYLFGNTVKYLDDYNACQYWDPIGFGDHAFQLAFWVKGSSDKELPRYLYEKVAEQIAPKQTLKLEKTKLEKIKEQDKKKFGKVLKSKERSTFNTKYFYYNDGDNNKAAARIECAGALTLARNSGTKPYSPTSFDKCSQLKESLGDDGIYFFAASTTGPLNIRSFPEGKYKDSTLVQILRDSDNKYTAKFNYTPSDPGTDKSSALSQCKIERELVSGVVSIQSECLNDQDESYYYFTYFSTGGEYNKNDFRSVIDQKKDYEEIKKIEKDTGGYKEFPFFKNTEESILMDCRQEAGDIIIDKNKTIKEECIKKSYTSQLGPTVQTPIAKDQLFTPKYTGYFLLSWGPPKDALLKKYQEIISNCNDAACIDAAQTELTNSKSLSAEDKKILAESVKIAEEATFFTAERGDANKAAGKELAEICKRDYAIVGFSGLGEKCDGLLDSEGNIIDYSKSGGGFNAIMGLLQKGSSFVLQAAFMLFVILFIWTGFKLLSARGNPQAWGDAKKALMNVIIGLVLISSAWLMVDWTFETLNIEQDHKFIKANK